MRWGSYTDPLFYDIEKLLDEIHRKLREMHKPIAKEIDEMVSTVQRKMNALGAEVHDAGDKYIILFELPGFRKEDIRIRAGNNFIQINAVRKEMELEGARINLPEKIIPHKVRAKFNNGILEIIVPKAVEASVVDVKIE